MSEIKLLHGESADKLKELDDNSVDSVVTDPPYMLGFMGKEWDKKENIAGDPDFWKEVLRVLKPGGHLLAFGGSRTYHRMAVAIEDAGFEIRDQIQWLYGSGFPKSHNIGKVVDEIQGNERTVVERPKEEQRPNADKVRAEDGKVGNFGMSDNKFTSIGHSEWEGWGTALKPAHEPICMARKPVSEKTVAENVLKHGTGGINIDDTRIELNSDKDDPRLGGKGSWKTDKAAKDVYEGGYRGDDIQSSSKGRFPANVILDDEAGRILDEQTGELSSGFMKAGTPRLNSENPDSNIYGYYKPDLSKNDTYGDSGGASRFFYCPKASKHDRNEGISIKNDHPTVKPTDLMKYLITMVTPKGGVVLDPFMGSGTTGKAAKQLGFSFIGIEREDEYIPIAKARIESAMEGSDTVVPKEQQDKLNEFFDFD